MSHVNDWDKCSELVDALQRMVKDADNAFRVASPALTLSGFTHSTSIYDLDRMAFVEQGHELVLRLRGALGKRETWVAEQRDAQKERNRG